MAGHQGRDQFGFPRPLGYNHPARITTVACLAIPTWPGFNMINLPKDLADALKHAGLADFFSDCTNAHRNEYLKWIAGAKQPETRKARIGKAMQMLSEKRATEEKRARKHA